jgi:hypothetical protein
MESRARLFPRGLSDVELHIGIDITKFAAQG